MVSPFGSASEIISAGREADAAIEAKAKELFEKEIEAELLIVEAGGVTFIKKKIGNVKYLQLRRKADDNKIPWEEK